MDKVNIEGTTLLPAPVVIVGTQSGDNKNNFATFSWVGIVNSEPPMLGVSIRKSRLTYKNIRESNVFSVNIPSTDIIAQADYCGIVSGNDSNKEEKCNFSVFYGKHANIPLIKECPVNLECKVVQIIELPSHDLFISEILETHLDEDLYNGKEIMYEKIDSFIYLRKYYKKFGDIAGSPYNSGMHLKK